jgi:hypothetical protein
VAAQGQGWTVEDAERCLEHLYVPLIIYNSKKSKKLQARFHLKFLLNYRVSEEELLFSVLVKNVYYGKRLFGIH